MIISKLKLQNNLMQYQMVKKITINLNKIKYNNCKDFKIN